MPSQQPAELPGIVVTGLDHRNIVLVRHNNMVRQNDIHCPQCLCQALRCLDVLSGWDGDAAGMVVREQHCACVGRERVFHNFSHIEPHAVGCSHFMTPELFTETIRQAAQNAHKRLRQVEYRTQAADHPILWSADESYYLKFYIFQVVEEM